jgi:hypothetical protein
MQTWLPTLILVPLIGFGLYRRFKRTFGRQLVKPHRMALRIVLLSAVCTLVMVTSSSTPTGFAAAGAGLVGGVLLGAVGLRLTKFEVTNEGRFYVPNGWIGIAVTALFLGRLAGRLFTMPERIAAARPGGSPFAGLERSPVTLALLFLLASYYVSFYVGVLWKAAKMSAPTADEESNRG